MKENYITRNNKVRKGDVINVAGEEYEVVAVPGATPPDDVTIRNERGREYGVTYGWLEDVWAFFVKDTASIEYFEVVRAWEDAQDERYDN